MEEGRQKIEVCFSPAMFNCFQDSEAVVVVVDVLRATSAICTAFMNGAEKIIPVASVNEARKYKEEGFLVAAERDGMVLDFADFGNSPFNFTPERVSGKTIVYSTTNGTQAIQLASSCSQVAVGSYLNISALCKWIADSQRNVIIFCAGWKNRFSLEDAVLAGAITKILINQYNCSTICDSALSSMDLWNLAEPDLLGYIDKAAQRSRLRKHGLDDVIEYCHTFNKTNIIPLYSDGSITGIPK